jgi:hypothetical protein
LPPAWRSDQSPHDDPRQRNQSEHQHRHGLNEVRGMIRRFAAIAPSLNAELEVRLTSLASPDIRALGVSCRRRGTRIECTKVPEAAPALSRRAPRAELRSRRATSASHRAACCACGGRSGVEGRAERPARNRGRVVAGLCDAPGWREGFSRRAPRRHEDPTDSIYAGSVLRLAAARGVRSRATVAFVGARVAGERVLTSPPAS